MAGTLFVIGVGPGDPELLTLKAVRILNEVSCIIVPKGREEGSSFALSIIKGAVDLSNKEIIEAHFPMKKTKGQESDGELDRRWNAITEVILQKLRSGVDTAFITIGDPAIYSTFFYLYDKLLEADPELDIRIVPGVSSITAAASTAKISLGLRNERIAVIPAVYNENIIDLLQRFDTIVFMKVQGIFDALRNTLDKLDLLKSALYISKVGTAEEKIVRNLYEVQEHELNYFSMVVVKNDKKQS